MGGNAGGIGAFAKGFADSFSRGVQQRRMRDQVDLQNRMKAQREQRLADQFSAQQEFRQDQQKSLEGYRAKTLQNQEQAGQALQEYRESQTDLQQKQLQINQKKFDLDVADGMAKVFDPKIPKAARKMILKQTAKALEIDPKSQEYKDFEAMAGGLDDESLADIQGSLMAMIPGAEPGKITAIAKSILSGQISMKDVITQAEEQKKAARLESALGNGPKAAKAASGMPPAKGVQSSRITDPNPIAQQPGMGSGPAGGNLPVPGMPETQQEQPLANNPPPGEARAKALEMLQVGTPEATAIANTLLTYARDKEGEGNMELKVIDNGDGTYKYVTEAAALNKAAPSPRATKTPEEEGLSAEQIDLRKRDVKRLDTFQADADLARATSVPLATFKAANKSGEFTPGTAAGLRETLSRGLEFLGFPEEEAQKLRAAGFGDAATAELMNSAANQISLTLADKLGRVTNMSLEFIKEVGPQAYRTPRGNAMIIELMERSNQQALKIEDKINEYVEMGSLRPKGKPSVFDAINKIKAEPIVDDDFVKEFTAEGQKGAGVDLNKLLEETRSAETVKIGKDVFDIEDYTSWKDDKGKPLRKQFPILTLEGESLPYIKDDKDRGLIPPNQRFIILDPEEGPVIVVKKAKKKAE